MGNGVADDGEAGEQDLVDADVERVLGGKGSDVLIGSSANDTLEGGGGNDLLDGGLGGDVLIGGPGVDTADYSSRTAAVNVSTGGPGTPTDGEAGEQDEVDPTVENVTGGAGNDTLVGTAAANILRGGGGNDTLQGAEGNDKLYGDAGDDSLLGEAGADKLYGSDGADVLDGGADADVYTAGGGNDFLYNDDGVAETVNCGGGNADDAEVDTGAIDTFIGCEL
jgi:Ca2+-binding RTX toxin-like protein